MLDLTYLFSSTQNPKNFPPESLLLHSGELELFDAVSAIELFHDKMDPNHLMIKKLRKKLKLNTQLDNIEFGLIEDIFSLFLEYLTNGFFITSSLLLFIPFITNIKPDLKIIHSDDNATTTASDLVNTIYMPITNVVKLNTIINEYEFQNFSTDFLIFLKIIVSSCMKIYRHVEMNHNGVFSDEDFTIYDFGVNTILEKDIPRKIDGILKERDDEESDKFSIFSNLVQNITNYITSGNGVKCVELNNCINEFIDIYSKTDIDSNVENEQIANYFLHVHLTGAVTGPPRIIHPKLNRFFDIERVSKLLKNFFYYGGESMPITDRYLIEYPLHIETTSTSDEESALLPCLINDSIWIRFQAFLSSRSKIQKFISIEKPDLYLSLFGSSLLRFHRRSIKALICLNEESNNLPISKDMFSLWLGIAHVSSGIYLDLPEGKEKYLYYYTLYSLLSRYIEICSHIDSKKLSLWKLFYKIVELAFIIHYVKSSMNTSRKSNVTPVETVCIFHRFYHLSTVIFPDVIDYGKTLSKLKKYNFSAEYPGIKALILECEKSGFVITDLKKVLVNYSLNLKKTNIIDSDKERLSGIFYTF